MINVISHRSGRRHAPRMSHGELTSSERIGFWLYLAMGVFCTAILVAAAASAILA